MAAWKNVQELFDKAMKRVNTFVDMDIELVGGSEVREEGSGPNWLFDIDALTKSMNYKPVVAGNQSNGSTGTKACDNAGKARMETIPGKDYILLPLSIQDPPFSSSSKDSPDAGFKPSGEEEKKDVEDLGNEDSEVPSIEEPRVNQEKDASVNSTNTINTVSPTVNTVVIDDNAIDENIVYVCEDDPNMPEMEEIVIQIVMKMLVQRANINILIYISLSVLLLIYQNSTRFISRTIIGDIYSAPQTRRMTKSVTEQAMFSSVQQRINHKDFQNYLFCMILSQECQEDCLHKRKEIDYDAVFAPVARIEAIRLFLAYASFKDFVVYQMDVKSVFLRMEKMKWKSYVCQTTSIEDPNFLIEFIRFRRGKNDKTLFIRKSQRPTSVKREEMGLFIAKTQGLLIDFASWQCKKQTVVANSTTETKIHIDDESTICIVKNPVFHSKIKHIEIRHHFIRDSNEKKLIQMIKIHTDQNVADLLTKAFDVSRFEYLIASIGMLNL
ncbi:ribonuclease H-like domain-containing protein [Tanacetum coccineum]